MNRWKKAALICAFAAATMCNSSPVQASINMGYATEASAINIVKHFPTNMATGVALDSPLTIEFVGPIAQSFYQSINFNLFNGTQPIDGELYYNPAAKQIMFKAKQDLRPNETYTAQVSFFDGLGKNAEKVFSFRTTDAGFINQTSSNSMNQPNNAQNETLILTNANMGAGSLAPNTPLEITFSEAVDITTLKSAPVQLFVDNNQLPVDYKLSRDLKTITIQPRDELKPNLSYAVAVDKTLMSTKGSVLKKKTLIPFKLANSNSEPTVSAHIINETPDYGAQNQSYANQGYANQSYANEAYSNNMTVQADNFNAYQATPVAEPVQVIGLAPQNGASVTNLTQPITIGFNEHIKPETLNEFTFRLEDDFGPIPAKIHYFESNKQATLTPIGMLDTGKNYRVVVTQGVTDAAGRPIRSGITSMFSTTSPVSTPAMPQMTSQMSSQAPQYYSNQQNNGYQPQQQMAQMAQAQQQAPQQAQQMRQMAQMTQPAQMQRASLQNDLAELEGFDNAPRQQYQVQNYVATPPMAAANRTVAMAPNSQLTPFKVTSVFPPVNSNAVARKTKIALHFSEAADPKTVDNVNISVFANQKRVDGKVTYDRKNNRAVFEPERQLDASTEHKVIVSNKIKSKMGEPLTQRISWEFTTTDNARPAYQPTKALEADAAFYIPLVDSKYKPSQGQLEAMQTSNSMAGSTFNYVPSKHWAFKSVKHITNKGILNAFPFTFTDNVTRYEFATAVNNALGNLKAMQMQQNTNLRVADMVHLQQLIIEFRSELRSYGVNTQWFESFLQQQGVNLKDVENSVRRLNG
jgi:hypothetical protein